MKKKNEKVRFSGSNWFVVLIPIIERQRGMNFYLVKDGDNAKIKEEKKLKERK